MTGKMFTWSSHIFTLESLELEVIFGVLLLSNFVAVLASWIYVALITSSRLIRV